LTNNSLVSKVNAVFLFSNLILDVICGLWAVRYSVIIGFFLSDSSKRVLKNSLWAVQPLGAIECLIFDSSERLMYESKK
jgi:hypothetical protein